MSTREKYEGIEMADIMWNMAENSLDPTKPDVIFGKVYWEDCLEFADKLHRMGYRRVAEPETTVVIKGEVLDS